mgnify:CR=1 FL=1
MHKVLFLFFFPSQIYFTYHFPFLVVSLLLEHNADPFISDQRGRNCFTLEKTEEIGRLLEKYSKKNQYPDSHDQDVLLSI